MVQSLIKPGEDAANHFRWSWLRLMDNGTSHQCSEIIRNGFATCAHLAEKRFCGAEVVKTFNLKEFLPTSAHPS